MNLRNLLFVSASLMFAVSAAHAQKGKPILEMSAAGEVQIAPDGHVSAYTLRSKFDPVVAGLIEKNVLGWHFEPILVDGKPVVAKTAVNLHLTAAPIAGVEGQYSIRIADVRFGEPRRSGHMPAPRYPREAVDVHLGARVLLYLHLDESGNVVEVQPYQISLDARAPSEREAESWRRVFEKSSVAAAKEWHFDLTETVDGKALGTTVIVPIEYAVSNSRSIVPSEGKWKGYVPGPVHPAPWVHKTQLADNQDPSTLREGEALSIDSRFKLKEDVVGKAL